MEKDNKIVIFLTIRSTPSPSFSDGEGAGGEADGVQLPIYMYQNQRSDKRRILEHQPIPAFPWKGKERKSCES